MDPSLRPASSSSNKSSFACSASLLPEKMNLVVDSSSIFTTQTTTTNSTATTSEMETKEVEGSHSFGGDGSSDRADSNSNNKRVAVAPVQQQKQSHPSSSNSSSESSSSSSIWSLRSKNEFTQSNISPESNNDSQKSYQFCRICHEGDTGNCSGVSPTSSQGSSGSRREPLIAPCRCTGSVAMVHLSCLEHWLTMSNSEKCELCNFLYKTKKMPRTWTEFLTESDNQFNVRNMIADLICFFLLTPLLVISTYLCCLGAHQYFIRERWEAVGLITLSIFLLAVYFTWCHVTLKYHVGVWQAWSRTHQRVRITFGDGSTAQYCRRVSPSTIPNNPQLQEQRNVRNQRRSSALSMAAVMEEGPRHSRHSNTDNSSDTNSVAAANQFDYVNIVEEADDYFDYHGNFDSTENLYIVNQNSSYNNRFPYGFNMQQSGGGGSSAVEGISRSNIFTYQPVIVIPSRRHQRLLNTSVATVTEPNFPVMGLSSFTGGNNRNTYEQ